MAKDSKKHTRKISQLPNALTLANAGLGLLAISKAIDALARGADQAMFEQNLETACWLVLAAGIFDALDGKVARMTNSFSDLGAQLDSLADALTFGVAPAIIAKVLLEHEGLAHPRINFIAAAAFALMAILRLARFNVDTDEEDDHSGFDGLPTPAAAGTLVAVILMFLSLGGAIETVGGEPTPLGRGLEFIPLAWRTAMTQTLLLPMVLVMLPGLALLMVSRVRYVHLATKISGNGTKRGLIPIVFIVLGLYLAPVLSLFLFGLGYVGFGIWKAAVNRNATPSDAIQ
ncbi:CDP-alcohol phosphatidyltransferase [Planctomycetes bacterium Poly30]|uniref:CDP-alcohol phosphatidyltransferase n=1 Tax=Saltatorellus ferox TaxID=2528018 RepID=A0A518EWV4_9BACT|nr:CDP-alcohol phosphatidyltransferase [Planctomycetes bacterium Poly30]